MPTCKVVHESSCPSRRHSSRCTATRTRTTEPWLLKLNLISYIVIGFGMLCDIDLIGLTISESVEMI